MIGTGLFMYFTVRRMDTHWEAIEKQGKLWTVYFNKNEEELALLHKKNSIIIKRVRTKND